MALESATHIDDLNTSNPTASDPVSEGDDHIRLLKSTIKTTFPNVTGATTASHTEMSLLTTATNANTANQLVKRDASGDFAGGTITAATAFVGTLTTAAQTNVTSVGALDGGSITSGFGAIDNGSSNITTTGDLAAGKATIDDVIVNGSNIGHTNDTDLIGLASGALTVNGSLTVNSNISVTGTVDGVDVDDLNTKLSSGTVSDARIANILDKVYPVGSIYMSMTQSTTPASIFGGTWSAIGAGRVLIGHGTGTDTASATKTFAVGTDDDAGEYNHTLTQAEMNHNHQWYDYNTGVTGNETIDLDSDNGGGTFDSNADRVPLSSAGDKMINDRYTDNNRDITGETVTAHNNIQPYLTVYMWKRDS